MSHNTEQNPTVVTPRLISQKDIQQVGGGGGGPMHKQWTSLDNAAAWLIDVASYTGDSELLLALNKVQTELIKPVTTHISKDGRTLLHVTAVRERMASLEFLLRNAAGEIDAKDGDGKSPLYSCIIHTSMAAARMLVQHGADVSETVCRLTGETILHKMVKTGRAKTVEFLLESGAMVNATTTQGDTALHFSARYDRPNMATMLLDDGSDINAVNESGETALHVAINNNSMDLAKLLIKRKADVNVKDKRGMTALHVAVTMESIELVRMMLSTNSSHINSKEQLLGRTPLLLACSNGTNKMAHLLLEHGADANLTTNYRKSVLHVAASSGNAGVLKTVIKSTSNLNTLAINNMTALHYAVCGGYTDIVKVLLRSGVSSNMKDIHGTSSLHMASSEGNTEIVSALLQHDVQVNATNMEQQTALHVALMKGHQDVGSMLVAAGTDVNLLDVHDKKAEDYFFQFREKRREQYKKGIMQKSADPNSRSSRNEDGHMHVHFDEEGNENNTDDDDDDNNDEDGAEHEVNTKHDEFDHSTDFAIGAEFDNNPKISQMQLCSLSSEVNENNIGNAILKKNVENNRHSWSLDDDSENEFSNDIDNMAIKGNVKAENNLENDKDSVTEPSREHVKGKDKKFKRRNSSQGKGHKSTQHKKVTGSKRHTKSATKHSHPSSSRGKGEDSDVHQHQDNHQCQRNRTIGISKPKSTI